MNHVWVDESYGRDHVNELIREADQERLARIAEEGKRSKRNQNRAQNVLAKIITSVMK